MLVDLGQPEQAGSSGLECLGEAGLVWGPVVVLTEETPVRSQLPAPRWRETQRIWFRPFPGDCWVGRLMLLAGVASARLLPVVGFPRGRTGGGVDRTR